MRVRLLFSCLVFWGRIIYNNSKCCFSDDRKAARQEEVMDDRNQDWSRLGEEVKDIVQSAVESRDFQELNKAIEKTLNVAMDQVGRTVNQMGKTVQDSLQKGANGQDPTQEWERSRMEREQRYKSYSSGGSADRHMYEQARQAGSRSWREQGNAWDNRSRGDSKSTEVQIYDSSRYSKPGGLTAAGVLLTVSGGVLTGTMGIGFLVTAGVLTLTHTVIGLGAGLGLGVLGLFTAGSAVMLGKGISLLKRSRRFKHYVQKLGKRDYCSIEELAEVSGKSEKFVRKDVSRMIRRKLFRHGHLDKQGSCLMVTDQAYAQYQETQKDLERRQAEEKKIQEEREAVLKNEKLSEEAKKVIQEGNAYLDQIKKSNEAIPGEEISRKISRMEVIIGKIFDRVEEHPELISDLRRFMDYYLPTTVKLLNAYEDMDSQPVQGPNIQKSKKEIEDTLDTINQAFEKLLDSFFKDTAWDISSDISVLQTMLAQEGLTKGAFERPLDTNREEKS